MPDYSDDAYLLEVMASHATLAFRPDPPKVDCRCKCESKIDALIEAFNEGKGSEQQSRQEGIPLAFGAGVAIGAAIMLFGRRKR